MTKEWVQFAIDRAKRHDSGIDASVLSVAGFSTGVMRRMFSNLCDQDRPINYLEVGCYMGGTACAVINNKPTLHAYLFENGSQEFHERPILPELKTNLAKHGSNYTLMEEDFFAYDLGNLPKIDVYFYDAEHSFENQARALPYAFPALADNFLYIIDDTNWEPVWRGVDAGFDALGDKVELVEAWTLRGQNAQDDSIWHNGCVVTLCQKK